MDMPLFFETVARRRDRLLAIVLPPDDYEEVKEYVRAFTYLHREWRDGSSFMGVPVAKKRYPGGPAWLLLDDHEGVVLEALP